MCDHTCTTACSSLHIAASCFSHCKSHSGVYVFTLHADTLSSCCSSNKQRGKEGRVQVRFLQEPGHFLQLLAGKQGMSAAVTAHHGSKVVVMHIVYPLLVSSSKHSEHSVLFHTDTTGLHCLLSLQANAACALLTSCLTWHAGELAG